MALERLTYDAATVQVTYRSDKAEGPTAGSETVDALECLARLVTHIPDRGQVLTRYYGWYANRTRGIRRRALGSDGDLAPSVGGVVFAAPVPLPFRRAPRRRAGGGPSCCAGSSRSTRCSARGAGVRCGSSPS